MLKTDLFNPLILCINNITINNINKYNENYFSLLIINDLQNNNTSLSFNCSYNIAKDNKNILYFTKKYFLFIYRDYFRDFMKLLEINNQQPLKNIHIKYIFYNLIRYPNNINDIIEFIVKSTDINKISLVVLDNINDIFNSDRDYYFVFSLCQYIYYIFSTLNIPFIITSQIDIFNWDSCKFYISYVINIKSIIQL